MNKCNNLRKIINKNMIYYFILFSMNGIFLIATIVTIVYFIIKFIEMRYIEKENKPLKHLIRDCLIVYLSVIGGYFIVEQVKPMIQMGAGEGQTTTPVFTGNPEF